MGKTAHIPDTLIVHCLEGDRLSQKRLYDLLFPYLNAIVRRYLYNSDLHNDTLQEAFIKLFTHLSDYDSEKGSVKQWASRIAVYTSINAGTRESKRRLDSLDDWDGTASIDPVVMSKLDNDDLIEHLKLMPRDYFEAFNLHVVDGFEHHEIAEILNISAALSRQRVSRARKWVRKNFHAYEDLPLSETAKKNAT